MVCDFPSISKEIQTEEIANRNQVEPSHTGIMAATTSWTKK